MNGEAYIRGGLVTRAMVVLIKICSVHLEGDYIRGDYIRGDYNRMYFFLYQ